MPTNEIDWEETELPQHLLDLLPTLPANSDRQDGAAIVTKHLFRVSAKTLKSWPLPWVCPNGRAQAPTESYLRYAWNKVRQAHATTNRWRHLKNEHAADAA